MRLDRVSLRNFESHADTDWLPAARFVSLVGPNGAGKSAVVDAIAYALFDAARGRTDDLVRIGTDSMSVAVRFTLSDAEYEVTRGRSLMTGKSHAAIVSRVPGTRRFAPAIESSAIDDVQAKVADLLRLDKSTFRAAVVLQQGAIDAVLAATSGDRVRLLSSVLDLGLWERARAVGVRRQSLLQRAVYALDRDSDTLRDQVAGRADAEAAFATQAEAMIAARQTHEHADRAVADADARVVDLQALVTALAPTGDAYTAAAAEEATARAQVAAGRARVDDLTDRIAAIATFLAERGPGIEAAVAAVPGLQHEVDQWESARQRLTDARQAHDTATRVHSQHHEAWREAMTAWTADRRAASLEVDLLRRSIEALSDVTCPECGAVFPADTDGLAAEREAAHARLAAWPDAPAPDADLQSAIAALSTARADLDNAESQYDPLAHQIATIACADTRALADQQPSIQAQVADREALQDRLLEAVAYTTAADRRQIAAASALGKAAAEVGRLTEARDALDLAHAARRAHGDERDEAARRLADARLLHQQARDALARVNDAAERLLSYEQQASDGRRNLERLSTLIDAFGVKGIPARIVASALPDLEAGARQLLGLMRPGCTVDLRASRASKDGSSIISSLDVIYHDPLTGGEQDVRMLSGGERTSVTLALSASLSRLIARRAGVSIRTLVVDEPDGLDVDARRAFGDMLRALAADGALQRVILISHHPDLADTAEVVYQVSRDGQGSTIREQ